MAKDIKKELSQLWRKEPIQFHHFEFFTEEQINKIINDIPKKYEKKVGSSFLKSNQKLTLVVTVLPKATRNRVLNQMYGPKY